MVEALRNIPTAAKSVVEQLDTIVIGAGIVGLYQLYRLRALTTCLLPHLCDTVAAWTP
jgi:hypothetical protein